MLTLKKLKAMKPHEIFAKGLSIDSPDGVYMTGSGKEVKWVAVRGCIHDWAIYIGFVYMSSERISRYGDKVTFEKHIRKLVECNNAAFSVYRF